MISGVETLSRFKVGRRRLSCMQMPLVRTHEEPVYQLVLTTCSNATSAEIIARTLVEERLAACVNVLPPMRSLYRWRGQVETAAEQLLLVKIRAADYPAVQRRLTELHTYEVPEIIAIPIHDGLPAYLAWLEDPERPA